MINYMLDSMAAAASLLNTPSKNIDLTSAPSTVVGIWDSMRRNSPRRSNILEYYDAVPGLRSITSRIADDIATTNWELYVLRNGGANGKVMSTKAHRKLQRADNYKARNALMLEHNKAAELHEIEAHPMLDLLSQGNGFHTGNEVLKLLQLYLDLRGESFAQIQVGANGLPESIWPLQPGWVLDVPKRPNGHFVVRPSSRSSEVLVPVAEMLWIKDPNPLNPYGRSTGLAETLGDELETDDLAAKYIKGFFSNGGIPDAIVSVEGAKREAIAALKQRWADRHQGGNKSHQVEFTNGKVNAKLLGHTFRDTEIVTLRMHQRDLVNQTFNMPPELLGILEKSNRATIDAALYLYALGLLIPRTERIRSALQRDLAPLYDDNLIVGYQSPVPEDREFVQKVMQGQHDKFTRAEHRSLAELPANATDDVYVMNMTSQGERPKDDVDFVLPIQAEDPIAAAIEEIDDADQVVEVEDVEEESGKAPVGVIYKSATFADIDNVLAAIMPERIEAATVPVMEQQLNLWATLKANEIGIEANFDLLNPEFRNHIQDYSSTEITYVNDATKDRVRETLTEGVIAGEGPDDMAKRLDMIFGAAARSRSVTIARTETTRSANFGTLKTYKTSGIVDLKQWISTPDSRTRTYTASRGKADHTEVGKLNGQIQVLDNPFAASNGDTAEHPGGFGIAAQDINCRCTIVAIIPDEDGESRGYNDFARKAIWDVFALQRAPWEYQLAKAYRKAFRTQQRDAIRALRSSLRE